MGKRDHMNNSSGKLTTTSMTAGCPRRARVRRDRSHHAASMRPTSGPSTASWRGSRARWADVRYAANVVAYRSALKVRLGSSARRWASGCPTCSSRMITSEYERAGADELSDHDQDLLPASANRNHRPRPREETVAVLHFTGRTPRIVAVRSKQSSGEHPQNQPARRITEERKAGHLEQQRVERR